MLMVVVEVVIAVVVGVVVEGSRKLELVASVIVGGWTSEERWSRCVHFACGFSGRLCGERLGGWRCGRGGSCSGARLRMVCLLR